MLAKYNERMSMFAFDLKAAPVHFLPYENSLYFHRIDTAFQLLF